MPDPTRYVVHYTVTTHHHLIVEVPEGLRARSVAPSAAMDIARRTDPLELRRASPATGTSAVIMDARAVEAP